MKLKLFNLNKLFELATADEIDFIIYIAQFQNEFGQIRGIHFKDVCNTIGISKSNFYKVLYSLNNKNIINVHFRNGIHAHWDMDITDNLFLNKDDLKQGYINLNHYILHTEEFYNLTRSEKIIVLHLLTRLRETQRSFNVTIDKLIDITDCSKISIRRYINHICELTHLFHIEQTPNGIKVFTDSPAFNRRTEREKDIYNKHYLAMLLKQKSISAKQNDIKDTLILFKQYGNRISFNRILGIISYCLKEKALLIPRYINTLIGKALNGNFSFG